MPRHIKVAAVQTGPNNKPLGQMFATAAATGDERVVARIDLDYLTPVRKPEPVTEKEPSQ